MSYFVCGSIFLLDGSLEEREVFARRASMQALQQDMALQLGCNVVQSFVLRTVGTLQTGLTSIPYLLTKSPLRDTSDELVSPYALVGANGEHEFRRNANALTGFFKALLNEKLVQRVELFVVDSFDNSVPIKSISISGLE